MVNKRLIRNKIENIKCLHIKFSMRGNHNTDDVILTIVIKIVKFVYK